MGPDGHDVTEVGGEWGIPPEGRGEAERKRHRHGSAPAEYLSMPSHPLGSPEEPLWLCTSPLIWLPCTVSPLLLFVSPQSSSGTGRDLLYGPLIADSEDAPVIER